MTSDVGPGPDGTAPASCSVSASAGAPAGSSADKAPTWRASPWITGKRPASDQAVVEGKVMPHLLEIVRKTIETQITVDQTGANDLERRKNPWLYQRLALDKQQEEEALTILRKKEACEQRAMEAASLTNEDDAAFDGLKPYQDELDEQLKRVLGKQYEVFTQLGDDYEHVIQINDRMPEDPKLTDDQTHRLAGLINEVYTKSAQGVHIKLGEEEPYEEMMARRAADEAEIRRTAARFLTPAQIDVLFANPAPEP